MKLTRTKTAIIIELDPDETYEAELKERKYGTNIWVLIKKLNEKK